MIGLPKKQLLSKQTRSANTGDKTMAKAMGMKSGMKRMDKTPTAKKAMAGPGKKPASVKAGLSKIMSAAKKARNASK